MTERIFRCYKAGCDQTFESANALNGHVGGKHVRKPQYRHPIRHGTPGGYRSHQRQGGKACSHCKTAWAAYIRKIRRNSKKRAARAAAQAGA